MTFLEAPWLRMNSLRAPSCRPRRNMPCTVGMRGSSHPSTCAATKPKPEYPGVMCLCSLLLRGRTYKGWCQDVVAMQHECFGGS